MEENTEEGYPPNLIYLLMLEIFLGSFFIYNMFFVPTFTLGNMKYILLTFFVMVVYLGYLILQLPDNTQNGITLFTVDLIIIPVVFISCILGKIIYERVSNPQSGSMMMGYSGPTASESAVLSEPSIFNTKGGGKKRRRKRGTIPGRFRT